MVGNLFTYNFQFQKRGSWIRIKCKIIFALSQLTATHPEEYFIPTCEAPCFLVPKEYSKSDSMGEFI